METSVEVSAQMNHIGEFLKFHSIATKVGTACSKQKELNIDFTDFQVR